MKVLFMEMYTRRHMWSVDEELLQETALEAKEEGMSEGRAVRTSCEEKCDEEK